MQPLRLVRAGSGAGPPVSSEALAQKAEQHLQAVRARLESGRAADTDRERSRVKEKHKDRRLRLKGQRKEETGGAVAYLTGVDEAGGADSDGGYSSSGGADVEDMEVLALKMLQKG